MQIIFKTSELAVIVRHWFEIAARDEEHGCRVEIRSLVPLAPRGTESAGQQILIDRPLWRADIFDAIGSTPGALDRAHYHPHFVRAEPSDRVWDTTMIDDPIGWVSRKLSDLAGSLNSDDLGDIDIERAQVEISTFLPELVEVVARRLGRSCPSPATCLNTTDDVANEVPAMWADLREDAAAARDPRVGAESWMDVVGTRP